MKSWYFLVFQNLTHSDLTAGIFLLYSAYAFVNCETHSNQSASTGYKRRTKKFPSPLLMLAL